MKKPTLLIALEGGLISSVCVDQPDAFEDVIVVDYDTEGWDPGDLTEVEQSDGSTVQAIVHHPTVEKCRIPLEQFEEEELSE